jgi:hypothetical protein
MMRLVRRIAGASAFALGAALLMHGTAMANTAVKGLVELVRTHDDDTVGGWEPPKFWFALKGVTAVESCGKFSNGSVQFVGRDLQMLLMVMSALNKSLEVRVVISPELMANGLCLAKYVTVGNQVP